MSKKMSGKALVVEIGETETRVACMTLGAKLPQIQASTIIPTPSGAIEDGTLAIRFVCANLLEYLNG